VRVHLGAVSPYLSVWKCVVLGMEDEILLSFKWHMAKGSFYFYNPTDQPAKERAPKPRQDNTEVAKSGTNHTKFVNVHCQAAAATVSPLEAPLLAHPCKVLPAQSIY